MSTRKKSNNFVPRLFKQIWRFFDAVTKAVVNGLLRSLLVLKRRSRLSRAGFVLPTVVMVILVVTLLTTAIMIRSFDRSKNASNVRVDQIVLKAATPALDRARAKIYSLFSEDETGLKGNTPDENNIADVFETSKYTLGDETQIKLAGNFDSKTPTEPRATQIKTAWKFPVDTDNNGKFDTFTLYGIYFRNPLKDDPNDKNRPRGTTEARALPQDNGEGKNCGSSGSGATPGWYSIGGQLKKAFFTYVANVPITELPTGSDPSKYEKYKGNKGFSALEMQLDQVRNALDNNAVWYNDDLTISYVESLRLNGRVHTNSNLLVSNPSGAYINFLQVSSVNSCFYNPDNAKIVVGGNVTAGEIGDNDDSVENAVVVDLYKGENTPPISESIVAAKKTTAKAPKDVAGNSDAYVQRLNVLKQGARNLHDQNNPAQKDAPTEASVGSSANRYPAEIVTEFKSKIAKIGTNNPGGASEALDQTLETYFADRIRRVSLAEVPINDPPTPDVAVTVNGTKVSAEISPTDGSQFVFNGGGQLTPPMRWMLIQDPSSGDVSNYTNLPLNFDGSVLKMPTTDPLQVSNKIESNIGDRIIVGNNLPHVWVKDASVTPPKFAEKADKQPIKNGTSTIDWNNTSGGSSGNQRKRTGVVEQLDDLGNTSRNGFWESAAAKPLTDAADLSGGLRVVTGAGIYVDDAPVAQFGIGYHENAIPFQSALFTDSIRSFLPKPTLTVDPTKIDLPTIASATDYKVVWPDTMPMYRWTDANDDKLRDPIGSPSREQLKGDLQMRATVVYHYQGPDDPSQPAPPIACISSYYDPTDKYTADNANNISNNGKNYPVPTTRAVTIRLENQAKMVFPDGRWVNKPLYDALAHLKTGGTAALTLSDAAAIDAANCALSILDGAAPTPVAAATAGKVSDGAIKEQAFLDARQIKAIHKPLLETNSLNINSTTTNIPVPFSTLLKDIGNAEQFKNATLDKFTDPVAGLSDKYTLPLELRQPLEVRVTEIDLDQLRRTPIGTGNYLLPNSGIIYATRDDALPDISSDSPGTDFKLDPTRRPNGIRLINGKNLERQPAYRPEEKGLILASDLPVYIKGDFNLHRASGSNSGTLEEFKGGGILDFGTAPSTGNFYTRQEGDLDKSFACRQGAPNCTGNGDQWRAARILSDAITLLSDDFRDGYRIEGNYDLNNNAGNSAVEAFLKQGFWANNFATTAQWYQTSDGLPPQINPTSDDISGKSSYVMNGVTPIQRRVEFPEYKMERCTKLPVSECSPQDWVNDPLAGTTATPIDPTYPVAPLPTEASTRYQREHSARRVAFARDPVSHQLLLDPTTGFAQPLDPASQPLIYGTSPTPAAVANSLWFATTAASGNPYRLTPDVPPKPDVPIQDDLQYNGTNLLYYAPPEPETVALPAVAQERQLLLPGTPAFPKELQNIPTLQAALQGVTGRTILNGSTTTDPSDYSVCTPAGFSQAYKTTSLAAPPCPIPTLARAAQMRTALATLLPAADIPGVFTRDIKSLDFTNLSQSQLHDQHQLKQRSMFLSLFYLLLGLILG